MDARRKRAELEEMRTRHRMFVALNKDFQLMKMEEMTLTFVFHHNKMLNETKARWDALVSVEEDVKETKEQNEMLMETIDSMKTYLDKLQKYNTSVKKRKR